MLDALSSDPRTRDRDHFRPNATYGWTATDGAPIVARLWVLFLLNPHFIHLKHCSSRRERTLLFGRDQTTTDGLP